MTTHPAPHRASRTTRLVETIGHHPRRPLGAVLLFVLLAGFFGGPVAGSLDSSGGFAPPDADSVTAIERIEAATGEAESAGVVLLVDDPDRVAAVAADLAEVDGIAHADIGPVAQDGASALVLGTLTAQADDAAVVESLTERFEGQEDVALGGQVVSFEQIGGTVGEDLGRAELLAFPVLLVLSILFFRGRAALIPLVVGITTVLGTFLVLSGINQVYDLSVFALNLVIGLGLGLAIDYTLFLVTRYREELARQGPGAAAVATTMRTAGRSVAFSAATVAVALITLTVFPLGFLKSMGLAGAVVALVAAAASLVIAPAFFGLWGSALVRRRSAGGTREEQGAWYRLSHAVMRRPGLVAVVTTVVMLGLALPALRADWSPIDSSVIPTDQSSRTVADALDSDFGGAGNAPMTISLSPVGGPEAAAAVASYAARVADLDGVADVAEPQRLDAATWQVDVTVTGAPEDGVAQDVVTEVRALDDTAVGRAVDARVAGPAADFVDQQEAISSRLPLALLLLVGLTLLVLWLMTGSVVLPVKAVIMNGLTVGAALGVLTFVYQDGRLTGPLNYTPNGGIEPTDFLVATALVFALSTDYGVFLLGRIKELRDGGLGESEAVAVGVQRTGYVVTAAAILLAVAIGAFATSSISFIQQIGVATAVGVLVDAFVVRSLLVPALMGLLGKWNWWAPMPMRKLHDRIGFSEASGHRTGDEEPTPVLAGTP